VDGPFDMITVDGRSKRSRNLYPLRIW
jgi:hypothetical protein